VARPPLWWWDERDGEVEARACDSLATSDAAAAAAALPPIVPAVLLHGRRANLCVCVRRECVGVCEVLE